LGSPRTQADDGRHGKSDGPVVPMKRPNKEGKGRDRGNGRPYTGTKAETPDTAKGKPKDEALGTAPTAEVVEGRGPAKGNPRTQNASQAQDWTDVRSARERIREAAEKDKRLKFTTLLHHIYDYRALLMAYFRLKPQAAAGVDGVTWQEYGEHLEDNLRELSDRLKRGAYRAKPVRRTYIPKADGRKRPLGITALEDKVVQMAVVSVLNEIYEADFLGFSYGFRPERSPHNALDALHVGIHEKRVNYVLDADIRGFFDAIEHEWLVKFLEHRIADKRVLYLIQKWLNAGVLEDGKKVVSEVGTPQGGNISPLLANIYLHYVFDLWAQQWRKTCTQGDIILVRYADDFVVGFQYKADAERFLGELRERLAKFGLELHADKTRLIEFGATASKNRRGRGEGRPETFDFLGFTHICGKNRKGRFQLRRATIRKRLIAKLKEVQVTLMKRRHWPVPVVGQWLRAVVRGHIAYYGVPLNSQALHRFRGEVIRRWRRVLGRRSQRGHVTWARMRRLAARWIPPTRICHPWPNQRLRVTT
jgi:RNA-directed DNA polymerase